MLQPKRCALSTLALGRRLQCINAYNANFVRSEKAVAPIRGTDVSLQDGLFQSEYSAPREGHMAAFKHDDWLQLFG